MPRQDDHKAGGKKKGVGKLTNKPKPTPSKRTSTPKRHTKRHT